MSAAVAAGAIGMNDLENRQVAVGIAFLHVSERQILLLPVWCPPSCVYDVDRCLGVVGGVRFVEMADLENLGLIFVISLLSVVNAKSQYFSLGVRHLSLPVLTNCVQRLYLLITLRDGGMPLAELCVIVCYLVVNRIS